MQINHWSIEKMEAAKVWMKSKKKQAAWTDDVA